MTVDEAPSDEVTVRAATGGDVGAVCAFGERVIRPHYMPSIGAEAAEAQVRRWWNQEYLAAAVEAGTVVVAVADHDGQVVGVGQRGMAGQDHAIYKLYVDAARRGAGLGPRLIAALVAQLPADCDRVLVEHVAANTRAGQFYGREGFVVDHVEPHPGGEPALATVWRARDL